MAENTKIDSVYVVDASLILSSILPDEKVLKPFQKILRFFEKNKVYFKAPEVLMYEIGNSLKSAVKQKRVSSNSATKLFSKIITTTIDYQKVDFNAVLDLSIKYDLSFYDASYLYLVKINKCKLLTLDKKLAEIAK